MVEAIGVMGMLYRQKKKKMKEITWLSISSMGKYKNK